MNKKTAVSLLLIVLLTIFFSLALIGNLNVAKAGDQGTGSNVSATVGSIPGITVVNVSSLQSFIDEGFSATLTATIENTGSSTSSFQVTFCGNDLPLNTQAVTVASESSTAVSFVWNTTGFALGNYTLSAYAWSNSEWKPTWSAPLTSAVKYW